jgi:hypothetical protein
MVDEICDASSRKNPGNSWLYEASGGMISELALIRVQGSGQIDQL